MLPYIEQQPLYDQIDFKTGLGYEPNKSLFTNRIIPGLMCPSDPFAGLIDRRPLLPPPRAIIAPSLGESYGPNGGPMDMGGGCQFPAWPDKRNCYPDAGARADYGSHGMFAAGNGIAYRFEDCKDGLSNTFLFGEQLPSYVEHALYFHSHLIAFTTNPPPNYHLVMGCPDHITNTIDKCSEAVMGFKSDHPGGLNMAMADGSVFFINETINYPTWVFLSSRSDGEPVSIP